MYARGCGMKGVVGSLSCSKGVNWTVCLCGSDNCNSIAHSWEEDSGIQLADCINKNGLTMLPSCCNAYPTLLDVFMFGILFFNMGHDVL